MVGIKSGSFWTLGEYANLYASGVHSHSSHAPIPAGKKIWYATDSEMLI
jgi:glucose uptake protein GlcU